jgi:hypothetical protein
VNQHSTTARLGVAALIAVLLLTSTGCGTPVLPPTRTMESAQEVIPFEVLRRPERPGDDPGLTDKDRNHSLNTPDEWRWAAGSPFGKVYVGVNDDRELCILEKGPDGTGLACGEDPRIGEPRWFSIAHRDAHDRLMRYTFFLVPDGFTLLRTDGLDCLVRDNAVVIVNYPARDTTVTFVGDTTTTMDVSGPEQSEERPTDPPFCT